MLAQLDARAHTLGYIALLHAKSAEKLGDSKVRGDRYALTRRRLLSSNVQTYVNNVRAVFLHGDPVQLSMAPPSKLAYISRQRSCGVLAAPSITSSDFSRCDLRPRNGI
jgi:hypothetical protein